MIFFDLNRLIAFVVRRWLDILKWTLFVLTMLYLGVKLFTFEHYHTLLHYWETIPLSQFGWFAGVLLLLPVNWLLEAYKWQLLTVKFEKITILNSLKAVLAGFSSGFFTPNRVGELVGRIIYLQPENRKAGTTMSFVNSLTQNIVMAVCGVPAALFFFYFTGNSLEIGYENTILIVLTFLIGGLILYFYLPDISRFLSKTNIAKSMEGFTGFLSAYTPGELVSVIFVSLIRYVVFCAQFYFMLRFLGVLLHPVEAIIAIPTTYLLVTFSPTFAFSEVAIRSSCAVMIIGSYSGDTVSVAIAGVLIWVLNFVVPMLAGVAFILRRKQ